MLIVGERINTSRKPIYDAVIGRDLNFIQQEAINQIKGGATMLDVNAGNRQEHEPADLVWLVKTVQQAVNFPLCIDSPNPRAIEAALEVHQGRALVNSITAEKSRIDTILPLVKKYNCQVVGLTMGEKGIPPTVEERVAIAIQIVEALKSYELSLSDLFFDPLVCPISTDHRQGEITLLTLKELREKFPGACCILGLSNISFGLPQRNLLHHAFLSLVMGAGLDAVILDTTDQKLMSILRAVKTILGKDEYCLEYINAYRQEMLKV